MFSYRFFIVPYGFIILGLYITYLGFIKNWYEEGKELEIPKSNAPEMSVVYDSNVFIRKAGIPFIHVKSKKLTMNQTNQHYYLTTPIGEYYSNANGPIFFNGKFGFLNGDTKFLQLKEEVELKNETSVVTTDLANYNLNREEFETIGSVKSRHLDQKSLDKIFIDSDRAFLLNKEQLSVYEGNVNGRVDRHKVYEPSVYFKSDTLRADLQNSIIYLNNNVYLKKLKSVATSLRGEIYLESYNKKLKYYALYDDVKVVEEYTNPQGQLVKREAYGEKVDGFVLEQKTVLSGNPKVVQGTDIVKGNKITIYDQNELVEVDDSNTKLIIKD